jgi:hypothetical protein
MTVEVQPLNILGGAGKPPVTFLSDTFARGTLNPVGSMLYAPISSWIVPVINNVIIGLPQCNNTGQILLTTAPNGGGTATSVPMLIPCVGLTIPAVFGQQQFAQCTFNSLTNALAIGAGLSIMGSWNNGLGIIQWYGLNFSQATFAQYERVIINGSGVLSVTTLFTDGVAQAPGDVWRISFNPATNTNTVKKNGATVFNAVDGSPLSGGIPGFQVRVANQTAGVSNSANVGVFSCGIGA